jgi:hypothetical protein
VTFPPAFLLVTLKHIVKHVENNTNSVSHDARLMTYKDGNRVMDDLGKLRDGLLICTSYWNKVPLVA